MHPKRGKLKISEKHDVMMRSEENQDFISTLPNDILTIILSKLRIDEAVRCGVLSKRWVGLWGKTSHLEFDAKHMIRPMTLLRYTRRPRMVPYFIVHSSMHQQVYYGLKYLVCQLLHRHSGDLSSCRFLHLRKSLEFRDLESWIDFLVERKNGLKNLSLECEPDYEESAENFVSENEFYMPCFSSRIFKNLGSLELINYTIDNWYAFEECNNLKTLKLKRIYLNDETLNGILENCVVLENFSLLVSNGFERLVIKKSKLKVLKLQALCVNELEIYAQNLEVLWFDSIICPVKNMSIFAPSLRIIRSHCYSGLSREFSIIQRKFVTRTHEILAQCSDLSEPPNCNVYQNLTNLSIHLDLNRIKEAMDLSAALRLCTNLKSLEIDLPVFKDEHSCNIISPGDCETSGDCELSYPISMFWEKQELCDCVREKLKFVYMRGFKGKDQEMEFAKYLITIASSMKRITIVCKDSREAVQKLLSLPGASHDLSIKLKFSTMHEFFGLQNRVLTW